MTAKVESEETGAVTSESGGSSTATTRRRHRAFVALVVVAVLVSAGGLGASTLIRSPADEAADVAPPEPTLLTAVVEETIVRASIVLRGTVAAQQEFDVSATASESGVSVVTEIMQGQGSSFDPGDVLVEVSGRPILALAGAKPAYRDIRPGDAGYDVAQLQMTLADLGFSVRGDNFGEYGRRTKAGVQAFYESRGYAAPLAGDPSELEDAHGALRSAEDQLASLRAAADLSTTQAEVDLAAQAVKDARTRVAELDRTTGPMVPLAEVIFMPSFPAFVVSSNARVGANVVGPLLTVASGDLVVNGTLNPADVDLVRAGMTATLTGSGVTMSGTVANVAGVDQPELRDGTMPVSPETTTSSTIDPGTPTKRDGRQVTIRTDQPIDPALIGADLQITIESAASDGDVLAVPVAAISSRADGNTYVTVIDGEDRIAVPVEVGLSGGGLVEVRAPDRRINPGTRVVIGA